MKALKRLLKKEEVRLILISFVLSLVPILLLERPGGVLFLLSDILFTMGVVHVITACIRYISNVGLFKTFSYMAYKMRWRRTARPAPCPWPSTQSTSSMTRSGSVPSAGPWPLAWGAGRYPFCWYLPEPDPAFLP